ncbi:alpha/beta-hydrolase [Martensiomyces pterosporus]|nr:alpha/beta-hydrolase [Martensiomyces pterosporus]
MRPGSELKTFAHYARASYILKDKWDCAPSCQIPETLGTAVDYTWHNAAPISVGYIGHNPLTQIIVVSFRGTRDTDDWVQDSEFALDSWPAQIPDSMVHHGFLTSYQAVSSKVVQRVKKLAKEYPDYKIVFTGHSLGGAVTVLCAVDVLFQEPDLKRRIHIYTYGMPRIGNDAWADGVDSLGLSIYRIVYENDIVPHIPFQWLGYKHFAQEVWVHDNRTIFCGRDGESPSCSSQVPLTSYSIPDHSQYSLASWTVTI